MKLAHLLLFSQKPKANRRKRLSSFLSLSPLLLCSLALLFFVLPAFSQQKWDRIYGGANEDYGYSVQQTSDSGYIITGETTSFGHPPFTDVYLIKTNSYGYPLWTKTYGGTNWDGGRSVQQTSDGGYIIAGYTYSFGPGTPDYSNVYLIKTNASGDTLWTKTYGGIYTDSGCSVQQTSDKGYIIAGFTNSFGAGNYDVYLIKTNASGVTLWTRTYGGTGDDKGYSVQQTPDGGYIIAGYTNSLGAGNYDVYLIKTNISGDTLWTRTYGGMYDDEGYSVQQIWDAAYGGYIVAGYTYSFGPGTPDYSNVYLVKTNDLGDTIWTRIYGGMYDDEGYSVQQTTDGGYIIAGSNSNDNGDVYLIKTNAFGDTLWTRSIGYYNLMAFDEGYSVQQTSDSGYIIVGSTVYSSEDVYLIKTDTMGIWWLGVETETNPSSRLPPSASRLTVSPNPFTSFASVPGHSSERFALYDISGRKAGVYKGDRIGEGLSAGVYFLRAEKGGQKPLRIVKVG